MVQNHLLQVLCLVAMEPPVSFQADEIRSRKVDVLRAIRPVPNEMVHEVSVRGQYGPGWIRGQQVPGYRAESGVSADSQIETFAAVQLMVDNWRWQDVPFYLRTGKRMPVRVSEVSIQFKPVPHRAFPAPTAGYWEPNRLALRIQPDEGMMLRLQAKLPGQEMRLSPVEMQFRYKDAFKTSVPEAYETLLRDVMVGDATLFMRADQVEAAWAVITPVLEVWSAVPPADFPNYAAGTWGPREAEGLIAKDGRSWVQPTDIEFVQGLSDEEEAAAAS
jgi:glucose-6-phosphate 1-dehydrogenase